MLQEKLSLEFTYVCKAVFKVSQSVSTHQLTSAKSTLTLI